MTETEVLQRKRTRGRPRTEDGAQIENQLLEGALEVFLRDGYGGASMTKIVQALGISKTTLYARYASKEILFRAIVDQQIERLAIHEVLRLDGAGITCESGLRAYGNRTLEISLSGEMLQINRLIYSESSRFPELGVAAAERTALGVQQVRQFLISCAERDGVVMRNPEAIASSYVYMLRGWYANLLLMGREVTPAMREAWVENAVYALVSSRASW